MQFVNVKIVHFDVSYSIVKECHTVNSQVWLQVVHTGHQHCTFGAYSLIGCSLNFGTESLSLNNLMVVIRCVRGPQVKKPTRS
jgi:hypothetical protein